MEHSGRLPASPNDRGGMPDVREGSIRKKGLVMRSILAWCEREIKIATSKEMQKYWLLIAILWLMFLVKVFASAIPAPREKNQPASIVGSWDLTWGNGLQQSSFLPDGTCDSPQFGSGTWYAGDDGAIWFSERGGMARYVMVIGWQMLSGQGAWYATTAN